MVYSIVVNEKYKLVPLMEVDQEDIAPILNNGKGVYICNYPDPNWYKKHGFLQTKNYSIEKKERFLGLMSKGSLVLSPTQDSTISQPTASYNDNNLIHIGSNFKGRMAQIVMVIKLIKWLFLNRKGYDYCLIYNFYPAEIAAGIFAKYILRKQMIVDFEDDIMFQTKNNFYKYYFNAVKNIPDIVICINRNMKKYFQKSRVYVFNGFIDLEYTKTVDFKLKNGVELLYAGALDSIRGIDLLPDLVNSLRQRLTSFSISVTGSGPYEKEIRKWDLKEVVFLGFLNNAEYESILEKADVYLVLQKPDHPFSLGSFPSKIEYYSKYKKPIFKIDLN